MKLGNIEIESRSAALAPMAGVADRAFRELCAEYGATYVVSEMVSSKGLTMCDRKSKELLCLSDKERPAAAQIFGSDPKIMSIYREHMLNNQKKYKAAISSIEKFGAFPDVFPYKKPKDGYDEIEKGLKPYFNTKYIYFCKTGTDMENLFNGKIYDELSEAIKVFTPFYKLLLEVHEKSIEKGDLNE